MNNGLEIAIIGMAGRFPGAQNVTEFWHNLQQGVESIYFYGKEELTELGVKPDLLNNPNFVNASGKLDDIDLFAADFFGFNPREAELLDPQHRLFLESAWTALENAGYDGEKYPGEIGVFGGAGMNGYMFNLYRNPQVRDTTNKYQLFLASEKDFLTTRVSYKLNFEGPSVNLQTACSTSLVAVHVACQSLLSGECDMALAGGVAISLSAGYLHQEGGIYAPDGHCRAFDEQAQGTVGGSGVGIVVLKRLEDATRDRDNILAIIKGSAMNNDGEQKVSYTAPRIDTQAKVIRSAQLVADIEPETISYIETHGTGTSLGDPIEITALTQAFRQGTNKKQFCAIASVKPNVGHLDAAAGITSLIKTVLALRHQQIPPSINCDRPNPQIDWENSPFYVNRQLVDWPANDHPRRAGVSSFGIGGTNVHVVLEEAGLESQKSKALKDTAPHIKSQKLKATAQHIESQKELSQLLIVSAKSKTALNSIASNLADYLKDNPELNLADVAYTLQVGRRAFDYRRVILAHTVEEALQSLTITNSAQISTNTIEPGYKPIVFMFSGQGSQYENMAWELYQHEPIFKENCDRCFQILDQYLDIPLKEIIFPTNPSTRINETQYAQPAIFVIEYALAQLWMHWGVKPEVMIGHSIGEYVAAAIAEVFSLEDALELVTIRGQLMQQQPPGVMLSVALSASEIEQYLNDQVCLAVSNAPTISVVSGTENVIAELETELNNQGIACRKLKTSHAFHSYSMDDAIAPFVEAVRKIKLNYPRIPYISSVTGTWITDQQATNPEYWGQHIRQTVKFAEGIAEITQEPKRILLEVGAGKTLNILAKQTSQEHTILSSIRHPKDASSDHDFLLNTCGQLWLSGAAIDWHKFYTEQPCRIPLPTYPFERKRYWIDAPTEEITYSSNLAIGQNYSSNNWFYLPSWTRTLPLPRVNSAELAQNKNCWLVFQEPTELGERLTQKLINAEQQIIPVIKGETFTVEENKITISPTESNNYQQLIEYLLTEDLIPDNIVYLWELKPNDNFSKLLNLVRALDSKKLVQTIQINIVVNHLSEVIGVENIDINKSRILGITKVINQEYPNLNCRLIDIDNEVTESNINCLISEMTAPESELTIAYRKGHRWLQIYQSYSIEDKQSRLKQQGIYLIFGHLGSGLGLVFAEYLVNNFQAQLILITDKEEKPSEENLDINCVTLSIDINNEQEVSQAIAEIESSYGKFDGVFYVTPMTNQNSASLIAEINNSHWEYNYQTKINPLNILSTVLADKELDFVLVQSSLSSILGGLGLAAYASANCYLDAFVEQKNHDPNNQTPWFSVNWDAYRTEEDNNNSSGVGKSLAEFSLTIPEVWEAMEKILSMETGSQIIVSKGDLQARIERWLKSSAQNNNQAKINNIQKHQRPNLANKYVAPRNETESGVAEIWQEVLGIEQIGIEDNFFELGGHSLLAIQTISRIRERFQVELPMSSILADTPTVANLGKMITKQQPQEDELKIISELLEEVQNMSPQEVKAEIQQKGDVS